MRRRTELMGCDEDGTPLAARILTASREARRRIRGDCYRRCGSHASTRSSSRGPVNRLSMRSVSNRQSLDIVGKLKLVIN